MFSFRNKHMCTGTGMHTNLIQFETPHDLLYMFEYMYTYHAIKCNHPLLYGLHHVLLVYTKQQIRHRQCQIYRFIYPPLFCIV